MAVLGFKPHTLYAQFIDDGYTNENGDYIEGKKYWSDAIRCDAVPSGKANTIAFEDGVTRTYSYTIYLPTSVSDLRIGQVVKLKLYNGIIREYEVKGYHRYQHQCKAWV